MNTTEFVAKQLALPEPQRVIPDLVYIWDNRADDLELLRDGRFPYNASEAFRASVYYGNAEYFGPNGAGRHRYYPNGVF